MKKSNKLLLFRTFIPLMISEKVLKIDPILIKLKEIPKKGMTRVIPF
jgi:hypothetical protein